MQEGKLYLVFEFLSMDLKKYMDSLPKDVMLEPHLVKVSSVFNILVQLHLSSLFSLFILSGGPYFFKFKMFCEDDSKDIWWFNWTYWYDTHTKFTHKWKGFFFQRWRVFKWGSFFQVGRTWSPGLQLFIICKITALMTSLE